MIDLEFEPQVYLALRTLFLQLTRRDLEISRSLWENGSVCDLPWSSGETKGHCSKVLLWFSESSQWDSLSMVLKCARHPKLFWLFAQTSGKGVKISHSHSWSGSYPFCFSSLMQCMAPFFAVHGFCSCSELSFSIFCLIFFLRGASRERGGGGIFMYSHHLPIDLLQFNSYLVSLVRCLILCRVSRKAEKWDPVPTLWEHPLENEHQEGAEEGQPCGLTLCCMFVKNLPWNLRGLWMALWVGSNHKRLSRRDGMSPGL